MICLLIEWFFSLSEFTGKRPRVIPIGIGRGHHTKHVAATHAAAHWPTDGGGAGGGRLPAQPEQPERAAPRVVLHLFRPLPKPGAVQKFGPHQANPAFGQALGGHTQVTCDRHGDLSLG